MEEFNWVVDGDGFITFTAAYAYARKYRLAAIEVFKSPSGAYVDYNGSPVLVRGKVKYGSR